MDKNMKKALILVFIFGVFFILHTKYNEGKSYDYFIANHAKDKINIYLKDEAGKRFASIGKLKSWLSVQNKKLIFATNAGIFAPNYEPLGLYIENGKVIKPLNRAVGEGNFYLQPNAVFYTDELGAHIILAKDFIEKQDILTATQSGPYLVYDGKVNPLFKSDSMNKLIRSGVGITPEGNVVFVILNEKMSFYEFANVFKDNFNCSNAMFLDGVISKMYLSSERNELDGDFAGIIGVTNN